MNTIENNNGLLTQAGRAMGYICGFTGHGFFAPGNGKVEILKDDADRHNELLAQGELKGLDDNCQIGQWGTFYFAGEYQKDSKNHTISVSSPKFTTWAGVVVSTNISLRGTWPKWYERRSGPSMTFRRNGKVYRGRLMKNADCFNFKRIA